MEKKIKTKIISFKFIILLSLFFVFLILPNNVFAGNCCEKNTLTVIGGVSGSLSHKSVDSCVESSALTKDECVSVDETYSKVKATFLENASCNKEKTKCVANVTNTEPVKTEPVFKPINFTFNVPLPGLASTMEVNPSVLPNYITWLYKFIIGVAGLLAVFMITVAGLMWIFAGGNGSKISKAREYITGAVVGLLFAIFSYSILYIINPQLILNKFPDLKKVDKSDINPYTAPHSTLKSKSEACYYNEFGESESAVNGKLVSIPCPAISPGKLSVHEKAAEAFKQACNKIPVGTKTLCGEPLTGGTFNWRMIADQNGNPTIYRSLHSWGIALDISPWVCYMDKPKPYSPLSGIQDNTPGAMGKPHIPSVVINAFKSTSGFRWGGDYTNKGDNMHFEWLGPCAAGGSGVVGSATKGLLDSGRWKVSTGTYTLNRLPKNELQADTLVIFYRGWHLNDNFSSEKVCDNYAWPEVSEVSTEKIVLSCGIGDPSKIDLKKHKDDPWNGNRAVLVYDEAYARFLTRTGFPPKKIIVAGHSGAWDAMNKLMAAKKSVDKYIWLDADYAVPRDCSKVTGIKTTETDKSLGDSSLCGGKIQKNITNDHFGAIYYLSNFLKDLVK